MKLYDDVITEWNEIVTSNSYKEIAIADTSWKDLGNANMILRSDMAYELGGSKSDMAAYGGTALTDDVNLVPKDEILLIGPDLPEIHEDVPYARLAICRVNAEKMGEGNVLYNAVRKIEYTRYHVNPDGFMMRVSTTHDRENVRVGKDALARGLTFEKAGNLMLKAFHENSNVEAVRLIFITDTSFDYNGLHKAIQKSELITKTIDHIFKNTTMDCHTCSLQEVCEEVEGMKELHFGVSTANPS